MLLNYYVIEFIHWHSCYTRVPPLVYMQTCIYIISFNLYTILKIKRVLVDLIEQEDRTFRQLMCEEYYKRPRRILSPNVEILKCSL